VRRDTSNPWTRQYPSHDDPRIGSLRVLIEFDRAEIERHCPARTCGHFLARSPRSQSARADVDVATSDKDGQQQRGSIGDRGGGEVRDSTISRDDCFTILAAILSASLVVSPGGGNDKKRSQLNKSVTQPLAPGLLQLITRFFSVNLHHAARLSFEIRQTIPERFLGRMTNVFHPGNINHARVRDSGHVL